MYHSNKCIKLKCGVYTNRPREKDLKLPLHNRSRHERVLLPCRLLDSIHCFSSLNFWFSCWSDEHITQNTYTIRMDYFDKTVFQFESMTREASMTRKSFWMERKMENIVMNSIAFPFQYKFDWIWMEKTRWSYHSRFTPRILIYSIILTTWNLKFEIFFHKIHENESRNSHQSVTIINCLLCSFSLAMWMMRKASMVKICFRSLLNRNGFFFYK